MWHDILFWFVVLALVAVVIIACYGYQAFRGPCPPVWWGECPRCTAPRTPETDRKGYCFRCGYKFTQDDNLRRDQTP